MADIRAFIKQKAPVFVLILLQILFIVLIGIFARYDVTADAKEQVKVRKNGQLPMVQYYTHLSDITAMTFIGFGFLITFLKRYGFSSFGYNLLLAAFVIQAAVIVNGIAAKIVKRPDSAEVRLYKMIYGLFPAVSVLISLGAVLGKTSLFQLIIMSVFELIFFVTNEFLSAYLLFTEDIGGSLIIHAFGAYFGLTVARILHNEDIHASKKDQSVYHSDIFALIGTIFLWVFWPSFNAAIAEGDFKHRAVINTFYAMTAATVVTFAMSILLDNKAKLNVIHIQNATLAGGVAVGTCADLMIMPYGAMILGAVGGIVSTFGFKYVTPFLTAKLKIHDTCGVNNLHGMPAILAGIAGALASAFASEQRYGASLYNKFTARAPNNATILAALNTNYCSDVQLGLGRSAYAQGVYQLLLLFMTVGIAVVGGVITGFIMKISIFQQPKGDSLFEDDDNWYLPVDGVPSAMYYHQLPIDAPYTQTVEHLEQTHFIPT